MLNRICTKGLTVAAVVFVAGASASAQQFIPIGPLAGDERTRVTGVSGDGSVVTGTSSATFEWRAFIWTKQDGLTELDAYSPGGTWSRGFAVSADGTTVVGQSNPGGGSGGESVRWVNGGAAELLDQDPNSGFGFGAAVDVSGDGSVAVGEGDWDGPFGLMLMGFRWTEATGKVDLFEPGDVEVVATAVSEDGSTVVGLAENGIPEAFRWTEAGGREGLGFLPGFGGFSTATSLSADGGVIGGQADVGSAGWDAAYWTQDTGWVAIPSIIPSAFRANAVTAMSGDGSVMAGYNSGTNPAANALFIWDAENGVRDLQSALETEFGVDFMGWEIGSVTGMSSDGNAIIGNATNPNTQTQWGWIVYLTPDCPPDWNGDGVVDSDDLFDFLADWADGDADYNGDGVTDSDDLFEFLSDWADGC